MTSTAIHPDIRSAARTRLLGVAGLPAQAWEGVAFAPTIGTPHLREQMLPIGDTPISNGVTSHEVLFVLTLFYPSGDGTLNLELMAGALLDRFKVGTRFDYGSAKVRCSRADRGTIITATDWVQTNVKARMWADTFN